MKFSLVRLIARLIKYCWLINQSVHCRYGQYTLAYHPEFGTRNTSEQWTLRKRISSLRFLSVISLLCTNVWASFSMLNAYILQNEEDWFINGVGLSILYPQKLAISSPTSGGRSVGIVRSRTQTMEFVCLFVCLFVGLSIIFRIT
jgi:hypothetical protein